MALITIGETTILGTVDSGNQNILNAQPATLSQSATLQSLTFYCDTNPTVPGNLRLGVYDATGATGLPGNLMAQTASFVPTAPAWNTANVLTPVLLSAATYWLIYFTDYVNMTYRVTAAGSFAQATQTFGPMPATYPASPGTGTAHWSLYATLDTGGALLQAQVCL